MPAAEGFAMLDGPDHRCESRSKHVLPRPGFTASGLHLTATPIDASRKLAGVLLGSDGEPLPDALLIARADTWWRSWQGLATTDALGRFEMVGPSSGAELQLMLAQFSATPVALGTFNCGRDVVVKR